ncbi:MAG: hypothetical protein ACI4WS_04950 [Oscillospiraceae bacterium]
MKSNVCRIGRDGKCLANVLSEVEKAAAYNGLDEKHSLRLRLLAEELVKMLPELVDVYSGSFWVENDKQSYELHALLKADEMNPLKKGEIISVSKSGKNAAASGILGMLRNALENLYQYADSVGAPMPLGFGDGSAMYCDYSCAWSMDLYMQQAELQNKKKNWDELEKSIIASFSDDVIVGIKGRQIEIIVRKDFGKSGE